MENLKKSFTPKVILSLVIVVIIVPFLPLLISGNWKWWEAWTFAVICVFGFIVSRVLAGRKYPDLIKERARLTDHKDAKSWDKILAPMVGLGGVLIPLIAGLDARFNWSSPFGQSLKIISLFLILAGYSVGAYAIIANRFFSGVVRIQTDRGQQVVSTGPYRWVRHPGYSGTILFYICTPIFLDSWRAFAPAILFIIILIIRTGLEDKTLQNELPGYRDYSLKVRYRLLPGIW